MSLPTPNRTVLITGAAKRLGREIALTLAKDGWQVAVHYRSSLEDAKRTVADCVRLAGASAAFCSDLNDEVAVRNLLPEVVRHFGRVDAVVNNAAAFEHDTPGSFSFAALDKHMHSNTGAAIILAQALHTHVLARAAAADTQTRTSQGVVVNLLDQKLWNQNPDFFSYTLSKAALEAATNLMAMALSPQLRVIGVAPGLTLTSHLLSPEKFAALHQLAPLGRSSTPADVAAAVKFAIDNCSITGTTLLVDGGQHLMKLERDFSLL